MAASIAQLMERARAARPVAPRAAPAVLKRRWSMGLTKARVYDRWDADRAASEQEFGERHRVEDRRRVIVDTFREAAGRR